MNGAPPPSAGGDGLPAAFLERLECLAGEHTPQVLQAIARPRAVAVRQNPLKPVDSPWERLATAGLRLQPLPWYPSARVVPAEQRTLLSHHPLVGAGHLYIQNPASLLPVLALDPRPGERVLDLCAAPGSKTLQIWAAMEGRGWLSAVEAVRARFHRLRANLARHGGDAVHTYLKDGSWVWRQVPESFDRVLVDAPCSSEGQFQYAQPETYRYWSERKIREMARKQRRLLFSGFQCLRPGGVLVYSTCTLAPEENEAVVDALLRRFPEAAVVEPWMPVGLSEARPGLRSWQGREFHPSLERAVRILPDAVMEGFFLCRLRKTAATA